MENRKKAGKAGGSDYEKKMESRYQSICRSCTYSSYFIRLRQQNSRERISTKRGQNTEQNTIQDTTAQGNSDSQKVRKVYVAVGATFEPYTYIDENNQPAGYDVAVLQEIDNRLPQYEFQIEDMELANISVALDAKRFPSDPSSLKRIRKEKRNICLLTKDLPLTTNVLYTKKEEMISIPLMIWLERK